MSYRIVQGARNTLAPIAWRRGMGDSGDVCDTTSTEYDALECTNQGGGVTVTGPQLPAGYTPPATTPPASVVGAACPGMPGYFIADTAGTCVQGTEAGTPIGTAGNCPAGNVVINSSGQCGPASYLTSASLSASLTSNPAAYGMTAQQAAAAVAALNAGTSVAQILSGVKPAVGTPVASTNPFASISPTVLMIGAGLLVVVLLVSKKR